MTRQNFQKPHLIQAFNYLLVLVPCVCVVIFSFRMLVFSRFSHDVDHFFAVAYSEMKQKEHKYPIHSVYCYQTLKINWIWIEQKRVIRLHEIYFNSFLTFFFF